MGGQPNSTINNDTDYPIIVLIEHRKLSVVITLLVGDGVASKLA